MNEKKVNREATIENILAQAGQAITNIDKLKKEDDEFLIESAFLWDAEVVYE